MRALLAGVLAAVALGAAAAPARANLQIGMEDERLELGGAFPAAYAVASWAHLGVDVVRVHAHWWEIAPGVNATKPPRGFKASDPNDKRYDWSAVDNAIGQIRANGIEPMLTITGPGPLWATRNPKRHNRILDPSPARYADFVHAAVTRYRKDVDRYLVWNEPNQPGWLLPQNRCVRRSCTPVAPHIYRSLVRVATPLIHRLDRGSDVVIGELAPVGNRPISDKTPIAPLPFLRAMGCLDRRYKSVHGGRCKGFKAAQGDSFGYHPHPLLNAPDQRNGDPDEAQFADFSRLFTALDRITRKHRIRAPRNRFPVHLTEFGYQTSPPDRASGVSLALQTRYLQQAAYLASLNSRVRDLSFYTWEDEPVANRGRGTKRYFNYQSGLNFIHGKPKPALSVFPAPFVIDMRKGGSRAVAWGQVRPAADGKVTLMVRPRGASRFRDLTTLSLRADGTFKRRLRVTARAQYRYRWTPRPAVLDPLPAPRLSGVVDLARKQKSPLRTAAALPR